MLYGLGAADTLKPAFAALPDCYSQELLNCLWHDNKSGLPKAQCETIRAGYTDAKSEEALDSAIYSLPVCEGPSMVPYVGAAFAAGIALAALVLRR
jgi:hypothetical protein